MRGTRVLGLSIGTRKLGFAVVQRHSIFQVQMKSFIRGRWSPQKLAAILSTIERPIHLHHIKHIAIKVPRAVSHTDAIAKLITEIQTLAQSNNAKLYRFTLADIKSQWLPGKETQINKKQLKVLILGRYNLAHMYEKEIKSKTNHYEKAFEAVGVADIVLQKLKG